MIFIHAYIDSMEGDMSSLSATDRLLTSDDGGNLSKSSMSDSDINDMMKMVKMFRLMILRLAIMIRFLCRCMIMRRYLFESHLLCFQFAIRHSLTAKVFSELLQLLLVHLPSSSMAPKSIHRLKSFLCTTCFTNNPCLLFFLFVSTW